MVSRNYFIDLLKFISILSIISCHAHVFADFESPDRTVLESVANQLTRFAVPFLTLIFGYFIGKKLQKKEDPMRLFISRAKYFLYIYLMWCIFYIFVSFDFMQIAEHGYVKLIYWRVYEIFAHPIASLYSGTKTHLWFLPSLVTSYFVVTLILIWNKKMLLPLTLLFYVIGVLGGAYQDTAWGLALPFDTRDGFLFSSLFIAVGIILSDKQQIKLPLPLLMLMLMLGIIGQFAEVFYLSQQYNLDATTIDFVFSTAIFGITVALIGFSYQLDKPNFTTEFAKHILAINLIHQLFVELLMPIGYWTSPIVYAIVVPCLILGFSYSTVMIFQKFPKIKPLLGGAN